MDPDYFPHSFTRLYEREGLGTGIRMSCVTQGASLVLAQGATL